LTIQKPVLELFLILHTGSFYPALLPAVRNWEENRRKNERGIGREEYKGGKRKESIPRGANIKAP